MATLSFSGSLVNQIPQTKPDLKIKTKRAELWVCQLESCKEYFFIWKHMQAQNTNSDNHILFPGWFPCFGDSQASNYPDQVSVRPERECWSLLGPGFISPGNQCVGIRRKDLNSLHQSFLKDSVRTELCFLITMLGKSWSSLHGEVWKALGVPWGCVLS